MTAPPPTGRDLAAYEAAYRASSFEPVQAAYRKRLLLELLERLSPRSVLEVGCGLDSLANHWRKSDRFVVVEPGAGFASEARRATAGRPDVQIVEEPLETAAGIEGGFDLVLISGLLMEIADCGPLLDAARRLCAPGGCVHVNVPNARSFHRLLALEMGLIQDVQALSPLQVDLQQHHVFTLDSLSALVEAHGFEVRERGSYFVKPFTHAQMQALRASGFLTDAILDGLWGMARHMPELGSEIFVNLRPR